MYILTLNVNKSYIDVVMLLLRNFGSPSVAVKEGNVFRGVCLYPPCPHRRRADATIPQCNVSMKGTVPLTCSRTRFKMSL